MNITIIKIRSPELFSNTEKTDSIDLHINRMCLALVRLLVSTSLGIKIWLIIIIIINIIRKIQTEEIQKLIVGSFLQMINEFWKKFFNGWTIILLQLIISHHHYHQPNYHQISQKIIIITVTIIIIIIIIIMVSVRDVVVKRVWFAHFME